MASVKRKSASSEMDLARRLIQEACPDLEPVFGGHSALGRHRAPRDHTLSFRLRDWLASFTPDEVRRLVARANRKATNRRRH